MRSLSPLEETNTHASDTQMQHGQCVFASQQARVEEANAGNLQQAEATTMDEPGQPLCSHTPHTGLRALTIINTNAVATMIQATSPVLYNAAVPSGSV